MTALINLVSAALIEKDINGDILWTWSYPGIAKEQRELVIRKCSFTKKTSNIRFTYGHFKSIWHYIYATDVDSVALPKVNSFCLVLFTKDFNPEKYEVLTHLLAGHYDKSGSPVSMLESYLSVITKGKCSGEENGTFSVKDYDTKQAYATGSVKDVINSLGVEVILLYTALLLKKRIAVYHSRLEDVLNFTRALPALVWHRQNWNIIFPNVDLVDEEIEDLRSTRGYVAGFTNPGIESRNDLFDVFVNLSTNEITVAPQAKESMVMGKLHKDIAMFMTQYAQDEEITNQQLIKEIAVKTKEVMTNLKSLATVGTDNQVQISLEIIKERNFPAAIQNFLFNLAAAEGLVTI